MSHTAMLKILLVTPFSPSIGGGSVNLRTLIHGFKSSAVDWRFYGAGVGHNLIGASPLQGSFLKQWMQFGQIWTGHVTGELQRLIDSVSSISAEVCWLVLHNEMLPLAVQLRKRFGQKMHLSVHDDVPEAIYARSRRFRHLRWLARRFQRLHLPAFTSMDVTSVNMQRYYQEEYRLNSTVVHPVVWNSVLAPESSLSDDELRIGHIGSLYSRREWLCMLAGAERWAKDTGRRIRIDIIGNPGQDAVPPAGFSGTVKFVGQMEENEAIQLLSHCHVLYAMYPFDRRHRVFRETSQPTKLSTYMRVARPIFCHAPIGSSLGFFLERFNVGCECTSLDPRDIAQSIGQMMRKQFLRNSYKQALTQEYGPENSRLLEHMLQTCASR